jgi:predicted O-methyltransferase YrrM
MRLTSYAAARRRRGSLDPHAHGAEAYARAMRSSVRGLLSELHESGRRFDAAQPDRLDRLRNLEPESGALLNLIVRGLGARHVLELGTSNGVSTLWLADALASTGGRLVSVELDRDRSRAARENLERAGLDGLVELRTGDAADALRDSADGAWDVVFLDAERPEYPGYWPDLARVIRPGGLIAADNAISHADQMQPFRDLVEADPRTITALDATGAGILLVLMTHDVAT